MFEIVDENCAIWYMKIYCNTVIHCHRLSYTVKRYLSGTINALSYTIYLGGPTRCQCTVTHYLLFARHWLGEWSEGVALCNALSYITCFGRPMLCHRTVIHYLSGTTNARHTLFVWDGQRTVNALLHAVCDNQSAVNALKMHSDMPVCPVCLNYGTEQTNFMWRRRQLYSSLPC